MIIGGIRSSYQDFYRDSAEKPLPGGFPKPRVGGGRVLQSYVRICIVSGGCIRTYKIRCLGVHDNSYECGPYNPMLLRIESIAPYGLYGSHPDVYQRVLQIYREYEPI